MSTANTINFFAVPYAGGIAESTYGKWQVPLGDRFKVIPLEPAGHGRRMNEPFTDSMQATVDDLFPRIKPLIEQGTPWVIYGHSMGTIIAYELIRRVIDEGLPQPLGLYISGRNGPEHRYTEPDYHILNDEKLAEELKKVDGSPKELFEFPSLLQTFLPIIRNDYKVIENYRHKSPAIQIDGFITAFFSDNDKLVSRDVFEHWGNYCKGRFSVHEFEGHHFFIHDDYPKICELIKADLL
ncbi:thioesterase II family protein [Alteromonas sp. a30]|uniref:thioesterase II family protein n=1 Tax=Alteromonas sp. a30 TaxID=2730917 RepID=UPI00228266AF|nr:thioesterase domain-containing protein [Alteromonas sp. a30]MCY7295220.1 thioesterase [Alteromonas sp. a30]